jgi:hypothetical protein
MDIDSFGGEIEEQKIMTAGVNFITVLRTHFLYKFFAKAKL